jgi:hypothetical protein
VKRASGVPFFMCKCFAQVLYAKSDQKKPFHPTTPIVLDKTAPGAKLTIQYFGCRARQRATLAIFLRG